MQKGEFMRPRNYRDIGAWFSQYSEFLKRTLLFCNSKEEQKKNTDARSFKNMKLNLLERKAVEGAETLWPYRQKQKDRDVN